MLHSVPLTAPSVPCFTQGRPAPGPLTVGYAAFGTDRAVPHRLLPLNFPTLILDFDSGAALLTGPRARATTDGPTTWGHGISIGLTPRGAALLAGAPISEISARTVALDLPWASQLATLASWPARFARLDKLFVAAADRPASPLADGPGSRWSPSPAVTVAWWRLQRSPRVSAVAASVGLTRRRLERDFHRDLGLPPGAVARTARLQRSLTALLRGETPTTAAATGGFADQPHLTRTMRDLVGLTPAAFRAFVQDVVPPGPHTPRA